MKAGQIWRQPPGSEGADRVEGQSEFRTAADGIVPFADLGFDMLDQDWEILGIDKAFYRVRCGSMPSPDRPCARVETRE